MFFFSQDFLGFWDILDVSEHSDDDKKPSNIFTQPIHRMAGSVLRYVCLSVCLSVCLCLSVSDPFSQSSASLEEDEEKEIYCSSRGEGQFISDL